MLDVTAFFIHIIAVHFTSSTPTVGLEPISVSVPQNTNVSFKCTVEIQADLRTTAFRLKGNGVDIATFYYFQGVCSSYGSTTSTLYAWRCGSTSGESHIDLFHITETFNGETMECIALYGTGNVNDGTVHITNESSITVLVPISSVSITPIFTAVVVDNNQSFACLTDAGRPNARIQWYMSDGTNITDLASQQPDCLPVCKEKVNSTSVLMYTAKRVDHGKAIYCTANNVDGRSVRSHNVSIEILYGPGVVVLSPNTSSYTVKETIGRVEPITCSADCRPNCTTTWSGPNLPPGSTTSVLNLQNINRNQAGVYKCTVNNSVGSLMSRIIKVSVQYGPDSVLLSPSESSYKVTESTDSIGPINCSADCMPNCIMTWNGPYISDSKTSVLNLRNISRNQAGDYRCTATNSVGTLTSVIITVTVNYGPTVVILFPSNSSYRVTETTDSVGPITCSADCSPNCTMIWNGPNLTGTPSILNFQNINRNQAGKYQCIANNSVDSQMSEKIKIIVNYVPTINSIDGNTTYSENDTAEFRCYVDSLPPSIIKWKFMDGNNITILPMKHKPDYDVNGSILTVSHMNCLSMGQYVCEAVNDIGITRKTLDVSVICAPRLNTIEYEIQDHIAVKDNKPLNITVPVLAYPAPLIYWRFIGNDSFTNKTGYIGNTTYLNRYFAILFILNMAQENFGTYAIYAGNGIRNNHRYCIGTFEVTAARKPTKPSNITCSAGHNYIIVNWKPEYNGGSPQSFQVFYKHNTEEPFKSHPEKVSEADYHSVKIRNLRSSIMYMLKVYTTNIYNTTESDEKICNTSTQEITKAESLIVVGVSAGVGSAVVVISVFLIALFIFRRMRTKTAKNDEEPMKRSNEDEENDELQVNPLYVSSAGDVGNQSGIYSQVSKKKKKGKINKPIELGCVYENHDDFMKGNDQMYANQVDTGNSFKEYNPKKNKDGLIYADLDLAPVSEKRKFVILGMDNRNNYAIVDLSKKADPLPSDDEDEERKSD